MRYSFAAGSKKSIFKRERSGVVLIIMLAFVVLLTGIVVEMLARSINDLKISTSSASQTKVDVFAQGALDQIVGDLKQEIAAGGDPSLAKDQNGKAIANLYLSTNNLVAVPQTNGLSSPNYCANLIKRSAYNVPFFKGAQYISSGTYPASQRAANVTSVSTNQVGRYFSIDRWNKHYLLPRQDVTIGNYANSTPTNNFNPPDWVLVTRDGSNPTTWASTLAGTNLTKGVVGRYAYAIYDEGGLLDINVAGYSSNMTNSDAISQTNFAYKVGLPFADLQQLPGITNLTTARQKVLIDQIIAWRNYASIGGANNISGASLPNYTILTGSGTNYFNSVISNVKGFMEIGSTNVINRQTDRMFLSRQEMINFLTQGVAPNTQTTEWSYLQTSMQYLGTFSRDLNQPSYLPNPNRPKIGSPTSAGGNDGNLGDDTINPSFLKIRVASPGGWSRNDGSMATTAEPLVKKRFALNRLAWLTYKGPSAENMNDAVVQQTIRSLGGNPSNLTDPIYRFVAQGTRKNIYNYFGLSWVSDTNNPTSSEWIYNHQSSTYLTSLASAPVTTIKVLYSSDITKSVVAANREPDFFELLKSALNAGSIAKPAVTGAPTSIDYIREQAKDIAIDYSIIQLGANIIDQFDNDGFPTIVYLPNVGNAKYFRGVENIPYLNRLRVGVLKAVEPKEQDGQPHYQNYSGSSYPQPVTNSGSATLVNTGVGLVFLFPEFWNPHDWNTNKLEQTIGTVQPVNFRVYAETDSGTDFPIYANCPSASLGGNSDKANAALSPGFSSLYGFSFAAPSRSLSLTNTEIAFNVPATSAGAALFREPTVLICPAQQSSPPQLKLMNLSSPGMNSLIATPNEHLSQFAASGGGVASAVSDPILGSPPLNQGYIGFYLGAIPFRWVADVGRPAGNANGWNYACRSAVYGGTSYLTCRSQYKDPWGNWTSYDEKYTGMPGLNDELMVRSTSGFFNPSVKNTFWLGTVDPRSSRFGMIRAKTFNGYGQHYFAPYNVNNVPGWLNSSEGIMVSQRPDRASGSTDFNNFGGPWSSWFMPPSVGFYPGSPDFINDNNALRLGLFSQNNPLALNDGRKYEADSQGRYDGSKSQYYADADGVVRRAMAAWVPVSSGGTGFPATSLVGLPMAQANTYSSGLVRGPSYGTYASDSRPMVLNRPFRSVAELGYVFKDMPWKNIDFFTQESGDAALLDVFCINDANDFRGLIAGKINLNTRQSTVLQAIISGAYKNEWDPAGTKYGNTVSTIAGGGNTSLAGIIAQGLVTRTSIGPASGPNSGNGPQPLANISEIVGRWVSSKPALSGGIDGSSSYDGFSIDLLNILTNAPNVYDQYIQRFREAPVRALANAGQTRVWNLMIDLVAQTGRYPGSNTQLENFIVEGEQHYWVHLAIDRFTGQVLDKQIEVVRE